MSMFLAVDAGGTKTDFALADHDRELARVRAGTIKLLRTDTTMAAAELDAALSTLTERTGISMSSITSTCVGTAGERVPLVADWLREAFAARVSGKLLLLGDVEIALDAAFPGSAGVLVLAGTGSNVAGRDCNGAITTAGGWGPALGDEASGYRIGFLALRALFLAVDEGVPTLLKDALLTQWNLSSLDALVEYANAYPPPDFSQLASSVVACADVGDRVAREVLEKEAAKLGHLTKLVLRRLEACAGSSSPWTPQLAFAGSVMQNVSLIRQGVMRAVQQEFPLVRAKEGSVDPISGALWRARNEVTDLGVSQFQMSESLGE